MQLTGKTIIVTGAGSGMGEAMAKLFAQEGVRIVAAFGWKPLNGSSLISRKRAEKRWLLRVISHNKR